VTTLRWWTHPDDVIGGTSMTERPWFFFYLGKLIKIFVILQIVRVLETYNTVRLGIQKIIFYICKDGLVRRARRYCLVRTAQCWREPLWVPMGTRVRQQFLHASHAKIVFEICHMTPRSHGNATKLYRYGVCGDGFEVCYALRITRLTKSTVRSIERRGFK
jgi:hypothetical protein